MTKRKKKADLRKISTPTELPLLVSFCDLTQYHRFSRTLEPRANFDFISEYYEFTGDVLEPAGGTIIKFIGDAVLVVFPEERLQDGVLALLRLKIEGDRWLTDRDCPCRHYVKAHFGPVWCGPVGTRSSEVFDVFGEVVNTAAILHSNGFAITPQVFRKLDAATRKAFKKHTPPITYIPTEESHWDSHPRKR